MRRAGYGRAAALAQTACRVWGRASSSERGARPSATISRQCEKCGLEARTTHLKHTYIRAVRKLAAFLRRSPDTATVEDLRRFQLHLIDLHSECFGTAGAIRRCLVCPPTNAADQNRKVARSDSPQTPFFVGLSAGSKMYCTEGVSSTPPKNVHVQ